MQQQQYSRQLKSLLIVGVLSLVLSSVQGDNYLKESPTFLKPCKIHDPKNGGCITAAFENIFTNWKNGIPGLKSFGSIDPFHVKKIHLEQNNTHINIKLDMKNVVISGLSQTKVVQSSVTNNYNFKFLLKIPELHIESDYRIKGSIMLLRLNSTGQLQSELSDAEVAVAIRAILIEKFNKKFFIITNVLSDIKSVGNLKIHFGNLFGGNIVLEDSANAIFNENWRFLLEIMRPVISKTIDAISMDRFKKVFSYIPASYFFEDLP